MRQQPTLDDIEKLTGINRRYLDDLDAYVDEVKTITPPEKGQSPAGNPSYIAADTLMDQLTKWFHGSDIKKQHEGKDPYETLCDMMQNLDLKLLLYRKAHKLPYVEGVWHRNNPRCGDCGTYVSA